MIVLNILCDNGHRFEGWFASSEAFHDQCARDQVNCPQCHSAVVSRLPSAPRLLRGAVQEIVAPDSTHALPASPVPDVSPVTQAFQQALVVLATLARNAENVGQRFPEEARRIHYDEAPARSIRGIASPEETRDLLDEGILVLPALFPPDAETH